jgi:hypothetical protein
MTIRVNTPASVKAGDYLIFRNIQLEEKSFATSFIDGARTSGKLLYPPLSNPCTVSFWVKSFGESGEGSEGSQPLIAINDTAFWLGRAAANDKIMFWCRSTSGTQAYTIDSAIIMNHGTWYHIALTVSSSVVALYINGSFIGSFNDLDNASIVDKRIYMGCESVHGRIGNILIDELRIDKAVRTADEIRSWYLSNVPFYPRGNERVVL